MSEIHAVPGSGLDLLVRDVLHHLVELTAPDARIYYGELLLAAAREVLPPDSWRREQVLGRPGEASAFAWCGHTEEAPG